MRCRMIETSVLTWKSLEIFGKCSETFVWSLDYSWRIFGNLRKFSEIFGKSSKKVVISMFV